MTYLTLDLTDDEHNRSPEVAEIERLQLALDQARTDLITLREELSDRMAQREDDAFILRQRCQGLLDRQWIDAALWMIAGAVLTGVPALVALAWWIRPTMP